jgi:hypothetical protein
MAKAEKPANSKKQALEEYLTANPDASTKGAIDAMMKQGFDISESTVYNAKWEMKRDKTAQLKQAQGAQPAPAKAAVAAAPTTGTVNKTQAVKDYLASNPGAGPTEISAALKAQGIEVSANYAAGIKSSMKAKKRRKKAASQVAPQAEGPTVDDSISLEALRKAKLLVRELGGVNQAKQALKALSVLLD